MPPPRPPHCFCAHPAKQSPTHYICATSQCPFRQLIRIPPPKTELCNCGRPVQTVSIPPQANQSARDYVRCAAPVPDRCTYFRLIRSQQPTIPRHDFRATSVEMPARANGQPAPFFQSRPGSVGPRPASAGVPRPRSDGVLNGGGGAGGAEKAEDGLVEAPLCRCGVPAVRRTVKKDGPNKGKLFFVCERPQVNRCRYFEWADRLGLALSKRAMEPAKVEGGGTHAIQKRPRFSARSEIRMELESIHSLSFQLNLRSPQDLKTAAKGFEAVKVVKTNFMGVEKVIVPIERADEFTRYVESNAATNVRYTIPRVVVERVLEYHAAEKAREEAGDVFKSSLEGVLPPLMCEKLMDFQWHGIHFALKRGGRCLIGDDMGLGKTLQAIAVARVYMDDWPLLIICPSSLRLNWKEELLRWLEDDVLEREIRVMMTGKDIDRPLLRVNIVSYDLMRKVPPHFVRRCQFIIADESHYLKSATAKRSQAITPLIRNAKRALLLSGTPALSRPVELFPQINAISPILFPRYQEYVDRYCAAHQGRFGYDVSGASNLDELHTLLTGSLLIRRKKEEVLTQLPEKQRQVLWVQTKPKVMKEVEKAMARLEAAKQNVRNAQDDQQAAMLENEVRAAQNELYTLTGAAKLDSVMEFCKDTAETGCKFIVFVHHNEVMEALAEYITKKLKLGTIRIDGNTAQANRQMLCRKFQEEKKCRVALLSITAAGVGLTLTKATVVLFAELYWNPGSLLQAEDRAHRIGQRDCVLVKYLLARRTLDESMWGTVRRKLTVVGHSLTGSAVKMDVTENGKTDGSKQESISSFFKKKPANTQATNTQTQKGTNDLDNDIVEIPDDDITQTLRPSPSTQGAEKSTKVSCDEEILFPSSLRDIEPPFKMSAVSDKRSPDSTAVDDEPDLILVDDENSIDLRTAKTLQEQLDADTALARKLQAQFDAEDM